MIEWTTAAAICGFKFLHLREEACAFYMLVTLAAFALAGCDDKPPERTVFDHQLRAKDKARAVEGQLREAAERRAEQARESE